MSANLTSGLFCLKFQALGTACEVKFRTESIEGAKEFRKAALGWIKEFERTWSRFRVGSLICRINEAAGRRRIEVTPEQEDILRLCEHTFRVSGGLNDPSSFPLTRLWNEAGKRDCLPEEEEIRKAAELVSWPSVEWGKGEVFLPEKGMALEIGGFGKEYAVDQLGALSRRFEIPDCLVDLGRDVAAWGEPPQGPYWVVGVEDAREEETAAFRLAFSGKALATSGNGRRFRMIEGKKFGHIIDLRSGRPAENEVLTATCLADDCLTAGLLSTNACILGTNSGLAEIERYHGVEAILQSSSNTHYSSNIHRYVLGS